MTRHRGLEIVSEAELMDAIARIPSDHYVVWTGHECGAQEGSLRSRTLRLVNVSHEPHSLRALALGAARLEGNGGFPPLAVRDAVRLHQTARPAVYLLVRRTVSGDFVAVTDIPYPAQSAPIRAGEVILAARSAFGLRDRGRATG